MDIPRAQRLRCSLCGSRDVEVRPDRPDPRAARARSLSGGEAPSRVLNGIVVPG